MDTLRRLMAFVLFSLLQVLVLSRIQLFHCAMPLLYIYFIISFPRSYPRWALMLWGFVMGLVLDMFENTPGLTSASLTLLAFVQPYLLELFLPRDAELDIKAQAKTLGWRRFAWFAAILTVGYCVVFFMLEAFSPGTWLYSMQCVAASALFTYVLMMVLESARS